MNPHYFLAVSVPQEISRRIVEWGQQRKEQYPFKNWVVAEDYHITLHFLGDATENQLATLDHRLPDAIQQIKAFTLKMSHFGSFGLDRQPRIFWIGVEREPVLFELQKKMEPICKEAGFRIDTRPYNPHITIARKWQSEDLSFTAPDFGLELGVSEWEWKVKDIVLYRSHLNRLPKYEPVARFSLHPQ